MLQHLLFYMHMDWDTHNTYETGVIVIKEEGKERDSEEDLFKSKQTNKHTVKIQI